MAIRPRLAVSDILHRGLVWSLLGVSVWGIVMMGVVHRETLKAGRGFSTAGSVGSDSAGCAHYSERERDCACGGCAGRAQGAHQQVIAYSACSLRRQRLLRR
ncbi:hypothetical protein BC628DRAFT_149745 [Trametes gibbosa]|nr:hypothetical protein BC628DRAFT_149745 [Trametes gibbosa]